MPGLPKSYIKKYGISKKAWRIFKSRGRKTSRPTKTKKRKNPKRNVRRMPRRKKNRRGGGKSIVRTAFKFIRLGALVGGGLMETTEYSAPTDKVIGGLLSYSGISWKHKQFFPALLARTWTPYLMACLTTYGIPKLTSIIRRM